jgi:hypothetical protein
MGVRVAGEFLVCSKSSNFYIAPCSRTGRMPVPQKLNFLVGWASCPPLKGLLKIVQYIAFLRKMRYDWA